MSNAPDFGAIQVLENALAGPTEDELRAAQEEHERKIAELAAPFVDEFPPAVAERYLERYLRLPPGAIELPDFALAAIALDDLFDTFESGAAQALYNAMIEAVRPRCGNDDECDLVYWSQMVPLEQHEYVARKSDYEAAIAQIEAEGETKQ